MVKAAWAGVSWIIDIEGPDEDTGIEKNRGAVGSLRRGGMSGRLGWLEREEVGAGLAEGDITETRWKC